MIYFVGYDSLLNQIHLYFTIKKIKKTRVKNNKMLKPILIQHEKNKEVKWLSIDTVLKYTIPNPKII